MIRFPEDRSSRSSHEKSLLKERKRENSREILWFIGEKIDEKKNNFCHGFNWKPFRPSVR